MNSHFFAVVGGTLVKLASAITHGSEILPSA